MFQRPNPPLYNLRRTILKATLALLLAACQLSASETLESTPTPLPSAALITASQTENPPIPTIPGVSLTPTPVETPTVETAHTYQNTELRISLLYPASWVYLNGDPVSDRYGGRDGFFRVASMAGGGMTLEELAQAEVNHPLKPFGSNPTTEVWEVAGRDGRMIRPSSDQPRSEAGATAWGEVIVAFPRPVLTGNTLTDFFTLQADLEHLEEIARSVVFDDADLANERFPADSDTPAAGICAQQDGRTIQVPISVDVPSPRCLQVAPQQTLRLVNQTGASLIVQLAWYEMTLQPDEERSLEVPVSAYLAPGVHHFEVVEGRGNGPEIWVQESAPSSNFLQSTDISTIQGTPRFSPDGSILAIPTSRGVALFNAETLDPLSILEVETGTEHLAFSPNGTRLASGGGWHVQLWQNQQGTDSSGWRLLRALAGSTSNPDSELVDLSFSPDGQLLAAGFRAADPPDGAVLIWSAQDGEFHSSLVGVWFDFSLVHPRLAAVWQGSDESAVYSYSFTGAPTDIFRGEQAFFSPTGLLCTLRNGNWRLIDMESGDTVLSFSGQALAFSADGASLALLERGRVHLYRTRDGAPLGLLEGSWEQADQLQFSPDGQTLAGSLVGCPTDDTCDDPAPHSVVWRLSGGKLILTVPGADEDRWLTYSPEGTQFVVPSQDGIVTLWNIADLEKQPDEPQ